MSARDTQDELKVAGRKLRAAIPDVYGGYGALHQAAMGDGALPAKTKELIALAIAVTRECDGCILRGVRRRGGRPRLTTADRAVAAGPFTCGRRVLTLVVCGTWRRFAGRDLRRCGRDRSDDPCGAADT